MKVKIHAAGGGKLTLCGKGTYVAVKPQYVDCPRCLGIAREKRHRLNAAAPDLLAALELLTEYSEKSVIDLGQGNAGMVRGIHAARAAIAKAKGSPDGN